MITIIMCLILGMNISNPSPLNIEGIYSFPTTVDAYSVLALRGDQTFTYESGHGDCKVEVTGSWKMSGKKRIEFVSDKEFTKEYRKEEVKQNLIGAASDYDTHKDLERYKDDQKLAHSLPIYPNLNDGVWKIKKKGLKLSRKMYGSCFNYKGIHRRIK